jgi:hypothetical protein
MRRPVQGSEFEPHLTIGRRFNRSMGDMRTLITAAAVLALCAAPAFAKPAAKKPAKPAPAITAPVVAPAPPPPVVTRTGEDVFNLALGDYAAFQADVRLLGGMQIASAADLDMAMDRLSGHNPTQLARGFLAYGAIIAGQTASLATEANKVMASHGADKTLRGFSIPSSYTTQLVSAANPYDGLALQQALLTAARADSDRVGQVSSRYYQLFNDNQKTRWANVAITEAAKSARYSAMLAAVNTGSPKPLADGARARLMAAASGQTSAAEAGLGGRLFWDWVDTGAPIATATAMSSPVAFTISREAGHANALDAMTTAAALRAVNGMSRISAADMESLLTHEGTKNCFVKRHQELASCTRNQKFPKERLACMRAGFEDYGGCLSNVVGATATASLN